MFFFSTLGLGPGPLELGKLATKLEFLKISHFNKPFSIGEIKYMITLHKKISYNFFFTKFWIGKFFRQFWENLEETRIGTWAEFRPQIGSKKTTAIISEGLHNSVLCSSHAQRLPYGRRAGRDLYGATPYVTQDLSFPSLTQRSATPCGLLQQSWCTEDFS